MRSTTNHYHRTCFKKTLQNKNPAFWTLGKTNCKSIPHTIQLKSREQSLKTLLHFSIMAHIKIDKSNGRAREKLFFLKAADWPDYLHKQINQSPSDDTFIIKVTIFLKIWLHWRFLLITQILTLSRFFINIGLPPTSLWQVRVQ